MLKGLQGLFGTGNGTGRGAKPAPSEALSTALLLLELARADFDVADAEQARIRALLAERYALDEPALEQLLADAHLSAQHSVSLFDYVKTLNESLDDAGKREVMAMLWQVAYADGRIDKYEEHLLRRLADLLYIALPDYVQIKLAAGQ